MNKREILKNLKRQREKELESIIGIENKEIDKIKEKWIKELDIDNKVKQMEKPAEEILKIREEILNSLKDKNLEFNSWDNRFSDLPYIADATSTVAYFKKHIYWRENKEIAGIKNKYVTLYNKVVDTYTNLINNVEICSNSIEAEKYLKDLGINLTSDSPLSNSNLSLTKPVDVEFLKAIRTLIIQNEIEEEGN